jgi:hypothetical protein
LKAHEHELGELRRRDAGAREIRPPFADKLVEKPSQTAASGEAVQRGIQLEAQGRENK